MGTARREGACQPVWAWGGSLQTETCGVVPSEGRGRPGRAGPAQPGGRGASCLGDRLLRGRTHSARCRREHVAHGKGGPAGLLRPSVDPAAHMKAGRTSQPWQPRARAGNSDETEREELARSRRPRKARRGSEFCVQAASHSRLFFPETGEPTFTRGREARAWTWGQWLRPTESQACSLAGEAAQPTPPPPPPPPAQAPPQAQSKSLHLFRFWRRPPAAARPVPENQRRPERCMENPLYKEGPRGFEQKLP